MKRVGLAFINISDPLTYYLAQNIMKMGSKIFFFLLKVSVKFSQHQKKVCTMFTQKVWSEFVECLH
jgi:hypothetical protein